MKTAETIRLGTGIPQILTMKWWCQRSSTVAFRWKMPRLFRSGLCGIIYSRQNLRLHDIAMFNLLKVMEICLHENEATLR